VSQCGWKGVCVSENFENITTEETFCECEQDWSQTLEMNFFVDEESVSASICIYNEKLMKGLYLIVAVLNGLILCLSFVQIKRSQYHISQQINLIIRCVLVVSAVSYRWKFGDGALLGVDFTFSLLVSMILVFDLLQNYVQFIVNLEYLLRKAIKIGPESYSYVEFKRLNGVRTVMLYGFIVNGILAQSLWISTLTSNNSVSLLLVRTLLVYFLFLVVFYASMFIFIYDELLRDLGEVSLMVTNGSNEDDQESIIIFSTATIPKVKRVRRHLISVVITVGLLGLLGIFSDYFFLLGIYLFPLFLLVVSFGNIGQLFYDFEVAAPVN